MTTRGRGTEKATGGAGSARRGPHALLAQGEAAAQGGARVGRSSNDTFPLGALPAVLAWVSAPPPEEKPSGAQRGPWKPGNWPCSPGTV